MKSLYFSAAFLSSLLIFSGCSDSTSTDEKLTQAVTNARQNNWTEVKKISAEVSESNPGTIAPMLLTALAYEKEGDMAKAIDLANQCVKNSPQDFTANYTLGRLYSMDIKRHTEAFSILEKALKLSPGDTNTLILLCNLGVQRNEQATGKYLDQLLAQKKLSRVETGKIHYQKALFLANNDNISDACSSMIQAAACSGKNPELILQAARFIDNSGVNRRNAKLLYNSFIQFCKKQNDCDPAKIAEAEARMAKL